MHNTILSSLLLLLMPLGVSAQFYTISKASDFVQVLSSKKIETVVDEHVCVVNSVHKVRIDSLPPLVAVKEKQLQTDQKSDKRTSQKQAIPINGKQAFSKSKQSHLPELTIPNLYQEIIRNGIQHPRIVLAQAILETPKPTQSVRTNQSQNREILRIQPLDGKRPCLLYQGAVQVQGRKLPDVAA